MLLGRHTAFGVYLVLCFTQSSIELKVDLNAQNVDFFMHEKLTGAWEQSVVLNANFRMEANRFKELLEDLLKEPLYEKSRERTTR